MRKKTTRQLTRESKHENDLHMTPRASLVNVCVEFLTFVSEGPRERRAARKSPVRDRKSSHRGQRVEASPTVEEKKFSPGAFFVGRLRTRFL